MNNIQKVIYTNAISYYKSKDYLKASNLFYQLIKNDLKSSTCAYFGALSFYQSKKIKEAIELFEKTIEIKENFYHTMYARLFLVMLNIKQGDYEKANEHLNILLKEKFSNVLVYSFKGYLLYQEEDYEEAIKYYKKSLEMNPDNPSLHNNLGYNYLKINDHIEKAEYHIKEALKKNNQNLYYLDSFGWLLFAKKQLKKAAYVLEKALEIKRNPIILRHFNIVRRYIKK